MVNEYYPKEAGGIKPNKHFVEKPVSFLNKINCCFCHDKLNLYFLYKHIY